MAYPLKIEIDINLMRLSFSSNPIDESFVLCEDCLRTIKLPLLSTDQICPKTRSLENFKKHATEKPTSFRIEYRRNTETGVLTNLDHSSRSEITKI